MNIKFEKISGHFDFDDASENRVAVNFELADLEKELAAKKLPPAEKYFGAGSDAEILEAFKKSALLSGLLHLSFSGKINFNLPTDGQIKWRCRGEWVFEPSGFTAATPAAAVLGWFFTQLLNARKNLEAYAQK